MNNLSFNVHRIVKIKYMPGFKSDWHTHDFYHYVYVLNGTGRIKISDVDYTVVQDEFYLIPPQTYHQIASYKDYEFKTIEVKFTLDNQEIINGLNSMPSYIKVADPKIRYSLETILKEATTKDLFYCHIINLKFAETILSLLRAYKSFDSQKKLKDTTELYEESEDSYLHGVIEFVEKNISKQLEVKELAKIAKLSETYFFTMFKNKFGISPNQYINKVKLLKAKELMLYSDLNVTQISELLGFTSLHYFSKFFKKKEGISPLEYIEKVKNDIRIDIEKED